MFVGWLVVRCLVLGMILLGFCLLFFYNFGVAYIVLISFYWGGGVTVKNMGKLQDVLPLLIIEQILLIFLSSADMNLIWWDRSLDDAFHLRQLGSLCVALGRELRFSLLFSSVISLLKFPFFICQQLHGFLATDDALC